MKRKPTNKIKMHECEKVTNLNLNYTCHRAGGCNSEMHNWKSREQLIIAVNVSVMFY